MGKNRLLPYQSLYAMTVILRCQAKELEMQEAKVIFTFPLNRRPTKKELERFVEWATLFYKLRYELHSFELCYA